MVSRDTATNPEDNRLTYFSCVVLFVYRSVIVQDADIRSCDNPSPCDADTQCASRMSIYEEYQHSMSVLSQKQRHMRGWRHGTLPDYQHTLLPLVQSLFVPTIYMETRSQPTFLPILLSPPRQKRRHRIPDDTSFRNEMKCCIILRHFFRNPVSRVTR